jgi:hypothetical protein
MHLFYLSLYLQPETKLSSLWICKQDGANDLQQSMIWHWSQPVYYSILQIANASLMGNAPCQALWSWGGYRDKRQSSWSKVFSVQEGRSKVLGLAYIRLETFHSLSQVRLTGSLEGWHMIDGMIFLETATALLEEFYKKWHVSYSS